MIYFVCGPPSSQSIFFARLELDILREVNGDVEFFAANDAQSLLTSLRTFSNKAALIYCDVPDETIVKTIVSKKLPVFLISEPFLDIVSYCMEARAMSLIEAVRFATQSICSLHAIAKEDMIKQYRFDIDCNGLEQVINQIALSMGVNLNQEKLDRLFAAYVVEGHDDPTLKHYINERVEFALESRKWAEKFTAEQLVILKNLSKSYDCVGRGDQDISLEWVPELFMNGTSGDIGVHGLIDLTGPARALSYGPYMHLPSGKWCATIFFEVFKNYSSNIIMCDILADGEIQTKGNAKLPVEGQFEFELNFIITKPHLPVEVRIFIMQGAIEGEIKIDSIKLKSIHPPKPEILENEVHQP